MTILKWGTLLVLLLLSNAVAAEGGKERGDVGEGTIVQSQVRIVEPPAQWSSDSVEAPATQGAVVEPDSVLLMKYLTGELF